MRRRIRFAAVGLALTVTAVLPLGSAGCGPTSGGTTTVTQAGPPQLCTASPSPTPFCAASAGTCPLLADDTIACPGGMITDGFTASGSLGIASAPGQRGDLAFAVESGPGQNPQQYVELGAFSPTGAATFALDTFPPLPFEETGATNAGLFVVVTPQGAPIILSSIGGALTAAVGSKAPGGAFAIEQAAAAPASGEGWLIAGAVVEPGGAVDVLLQTGGSAALAHRGAAGTWTSHSLPYSSDPAAIAVDASGVVYTAGWVTGAMAGMHQFEIVTGSSAPVVVATLADAGVTVVDLTVGKNADGSALPVAAFGNPLTLAVGDGKGFSTLQPTFTVAQPYQDGCSSTLSLGNCSCPSTCSQTGDQASWVQLVRDAQGDVYIAWLEVNANLEFPVTLNSTSVGSQMVTCSCDVDQQHQMGSVTAVGLQLDRLVTTPIPQTQHRGTIPVPSDVVSLQAVDGNGTIQLLASSASSGPSAGAGVLRRVVLDASQLP